MLCRADLTANPAHIEATFFARERNTQSPHSFPAMRKLPEQRLCGRWLAVLTTGVLAFQLSPSKAVAQHRQVVSSSPVHLPATGVPPQGRSLPVPAKLSTSAGQAP